MDYPPDSQKPIKQSKIKNNYCKKCGGYIDTATEKCVACGAERKTFKKHLPTLITGGAAVILVACISAVAIIQQFTQNSLKSELSSAQAKISEYENQQSQNENVINNLRSKMESLEDEAENYKYKAQFLDESIAFVCNDYDLKYYHTYDCTVFQNCNGFWAYNIKAAKAEGFTACPQCH